MTSKLKKNRHLGDIPLKEDLVKREGLIRGKQNFHTITETVSRFAEIPLKKNGKSLGNSLLFFIFIIVFIFGMYCLSYMGRYWNMG